MTNDVYDMIATRTQPANRRRMAPIAPECPSALVAVGMALVALYAMALAAILFA